MKKGITSKTYFFTLTIIYFAQAMMLVFVAGAILFLTMTNRVENTSNELETIFQFIVPLATIAGLSAAQFIYKMQIGQLGSSADLKEKVRKFQSIVIIRSACLEIPGILSGVATLLTGQIYFLAGTFLMVIILIILRPTASSLSEDLNLSPSERSLIQDPNSVIMEAPNPE
ncbi:MAG: hypothetical protein ACOYXT_17660 [Bacteroidota bacterium]